MARKNREQRAGLAGCGVQTMEITARRPGHGPSTQQWVTGGRAQQARRSRRRVVPASVTSAYRDGAAMNPIDRIGQKVVCIQDDFIWQFVCWELPCCPRLDQSYTVSGFGEIEGHPGIHLRELAGVSCRCFNLDNAPWPIDCFRPLDERGTDIGVLKQLLKPLTVDAVG
jgi:hypothetical protein